MEVEGGGNKELHDSCLLAALTLSAPVLTVSEVS